MSQEILINVTPEEVRVASLEDGQLQEIQIERGHQQSLIGNIYKAKVTRLAPGMQAAFINIGRDRSAFLHVSDLLDYMNQSTEKPKSDIGDFIKEGREILVQVYKDALGGKGVRLTTQFSIPSRYLVLTPGIQKVATSQKITDPAERERLQSLLMPSKIGGYILRTAAQGASADEITADQQVIHALWDEIAARAKQAKPGEIIYEELPMILRAVRDIASSRVGKIYVDDEAACIKMRAYAARYAPRLEKNIEYYAKKTPLFDVYSIDEEIQRLLGRKVNLKSGGHIIIDQTEAMATIDVNTGSYLGSDSAQTVFQTNLEAVQVIANQVRLRNLGGIIIIDFIDMQDLSHREKIIQALNQAVATDWAKVEVSELSSLGLVQMARKRTRRSLEQVLCDPCPVCYKRGSIKSVETICYEIFRAIKRSDARAGGSGYTVIAASEVIDSITQDVIADFGAELGGKPIQLHAEPSYGREQYNVMPLVGAG